MSVAEIPPNPIHTQTPPDVKEHDNTKHVGSAARGQAGGVAPLDASAKVPDTNIPDTVERTSNKNTPGGYAGLDANGEYAGLKPTDTGLRVTMGSYTGNNTSNRAIAHGLGRAPKFVFFHDDGAYDGSLMDNNGTYIIHVDTANRFRLQVNAPDDTYFYVGHSASYGASKNASAQTYFWIAIG
jgi:hypothetical protein